MDTDTEKNLQELSHAVIGSCIDVHKALGPGLLESIYLDLLCHDLDLKQIPYVRESSLNIVYKGREFHTKLRADLVVDGKIIVELKAVKDLLPIFEAQILTYMKLAKIEIGLLINFNVPMLKDGIHRFRLNYGKTEI
ncbi:MAG: GxxExxY protein [Candidatus Cloacimonas sp.]|jgi:GxxExxY protein|nr:GxxExxY protein [Candidatus Cloacimonas sp.]